MTFTRTYIGIDNGQSEKLKIYPLTLAAIGFLGFSICAGAAQFAQITTISRDKGQVLITYKAPLKFKGQLECSEDLKVWYKVKAVNNGKAKHRSRSDIKFYRVRTRK